MKRINLYPALTLSLWLAHLINLYIWLQLDINYLTYDAHRHFLLSLKIFDEYKHFSPDIFFRCIALTQRHPPLLMMLTAPFYFIFGISQDAGVMINSTIFLGILIFATYKIGKHILDSRAGLLAAFILTMYPVVFNQSKVYMLDLPLTAIVALSIYLLIMSDNLRNLKYSALLLITLIMGTFIKQSFMLFIIGPLFYAIIKNLPYLNMVKSKKIAFSLIILVVTLIAIGFSYASYNHSKWGLALIDSIYRLKFPPAIIGTHPTPVIQGQFLDRLRSILWYFWGFINWQVSFLFFVIFIIGLYYFLRNKFIYKTLLLLWVTTSYFLVSQIIYGVGINMKVTGIRYTMPFLPAVALITSFGVIKIPLEKFRYFLTILLVVLGLSQLIIISYPIKLGLKKIEIPIKLEDKYEILPRGILLFEPKSWPVSGSDSGSQPRNAKQEINACEDIFKIIDSQCGNKSTKVTITPDDTRLWYLQYIAYIRNKQIEFICDWNYLSRDMRLKRLDYTIYMPDLVLNADYVIDKDSGWLGEPYVQQYVEEAKKYFNLYKDKFIMIKNVEWPDKSNIMIYKNIHK